MQLQETQAVNNREIKMAHKGMQGSGDDTLQTNSKEPVKICPQSLKQLFDERAMLCKKSCKTRIQEP